MNSAVMNNRASLAGQAEELSSQGSGSDDETRASRLSLEQFALGSVIEPKLIGGVDRKCLMYSSSTLCVIVSPCCVRERNYQALPSHYGKMGDVLSDKHRSSPSKIGDV